MAKSVEDVFRYITRSPVTIRLVTNTVLMISDLDFLLGILFLITLGKHTGGSVDDVDSAGGLKYSLFIVALVVGQLVYFIGICWFGPQQKYRVVGQMKALMQNCPEEFNNVGVETRVDRDKGRGPTFGQLDNDEEGFGDFQRGMANYELMAIWNFACAQNAKNCLEVLHGFPFFRLARYGFIASPTPADLGGILNANALYTFTNGIFQLAFGTVAILEFGIDRDSLVAMIISAISLVLTLCNILLNFSGILETIDGERRVVEKIQRESDVKLKKAKDRLKFTRDSEIDEINEKYDGLVGGGDIAMKEREIDQANTHYQIEVDVLTACSTTQLSIELYDYQKRVEAIRAATSGKSKVVSNRPHAADSYETFKKHLHQLETQRTQVQDTMLADLENVPITELTAAQYDATTKKIMDQAEAKIASVNRLIDRLKNSNSSAGITSV